MTKPQEIEGFTLAKLISVAQKNVEEKTKNSKVLSVEAEECIPKFETNELELGRILGRGGFCSVHEVIKITLHQQPVAPKASIHASAGGEEEEEEHVMHNVVQDRAFMQMYCLRGKGKDCRYALKRIQETSYNDASTFVNGIVDLAVEARFLAVLRHPNIIKMRATCSGSSYSDTFFVVLDRLYDILGQRLSKWRKRQPRGLGKLLDRKGQKEMAFWLERVTVAYDLACALKFLHETNVMYRDIKPDNIGFDVRDDVKIFDFGLAKEFDPATKNKDGNYLFTGDTGSIRYMATEVALKQPYNESVDVYSFSILLWQILKMETPYEVYTSMSMFHTKVVKGGARPMPDPKWPAPIAKLLRQGWGIASERPTMADVCETLRDEINKNSNEEVSEMMDASRRSEMSLHGR